MKEELSSSAKEATNAPVFIDEFCSTPSSDVYETSQEIVILVDMPGVASQDLDLELDRNTLSITGKVSPMQPEGHKLITEYCRCNYFRSFYIGDVVDSTKIVAELTDGVLKIVLPKAEHAVSRRISISDDPPHEVVH